MPPIDVAAQDRASRARAEFDSLRDRLVAAFERLEAEAPPELYGAAAGAFALTPWTRTEGGGGVMGMLRGRLFEKCGLHVSQVSGHLSEEMAAAMPGGAADRDFAATGLSLIAHMRSPRVPAVHLNVRYIETRQGWFGGGSDLTPLIAEQRDEAAPDAVIFHAALKGACDAFDPAWHPAFKDACDRYFFLPHRGEPRGVGGIFYDRQDCGGFDRGLAFSRAVAEAVLEVWPKIARHRMTEPWSEAEREEQLVRRGRYVEFNLLYDRGTMFGLKTGGNIESILSSMPPTAKWP